MVQIVGQGHSSRKVFDPLSEDLIYTSPSLVISKKPSQVDLQRQIARYTQWLQQHELNHQQQLALIQQQKERYQERAQRKVIVGEKTIRTFAPFIPTYSALSTFSRGQKITGILFILALLLGISFSYMDTLVVLMFFITILYIGSLALQFVMSLRTFIADFEEHIDDTIIHGLGEVEWPGYTVLCPLYKEAAIIPQFTRAIQRLDYPAHKLQVLLLIEEDDLETHEILQKMELPEYFSIVIVPAGTPKTKPRACNYGLIQATGDFVVIYDAEDVMDPLQLKRSVLTFANYGPEMVCVQAKLNFYNTKQNLLTRWFTAEYSAWFDLLLPGLQYLRFPLPLGGTSNHFRTDVLRALGGWDAFNVTEDCELGIRLSQFKLKTVVLNSTTYEEANPQVHNWIRQRSRWIKGYLQTYLVHMRRPLFMLRQGMFREFLALQFLIGGRTLTIFLNPILWLVLLFYVFFFVLILLVFTTASFQLLSCIWGLSV
ncbi:glycosyltransferase [Tengunoibacter tsumagoiensis]|uniref:Glycosyl transferase n=1 Tax=Tengunoibacter tsumagoiensis TaxID=2014871 RepID=A0A401ZUR5_9CHLR|nr:glycosyltransferase [Tengunoibacter tsumagoiensis]GCE10470.1 hypothetical protein KTT_03290 [Tengunoibacter tsumagoiensis]